MQDIPEAHRTSLSSFGLLFARRSGRRLRKQGISAGCPFHVISGCRSKSQIFPTQYSCIVPFTSPNEAVSVIQHRGICQKRSQALQGSGTFCIYCLLFMVWSISMPPNLYQRVHVPIYTYMYTYIYHICMYIYNLMYIVYTILRPQTMHIESSLRPRYIMQL